MSFPAGGLLTRRTVSLTVLLATLVLYMSAAMIAAPVAFQHQLSVYADLMLVLLCAVAIVLPATALVMRPDAPLSMLSSMARRGILRFIVVHVAFAFSMAAFTTFKLQIPNFVPFYADAMLAQVDRSLHGGDPGLMLHALIPPQLAGILVFAYTDMWFFAWLGMLTFVALQPNPALRERYLWGLAATFILGGSVIATMLSSVGPIFHHDLLGSGRFAALMQGVYSSGARDTTWRAANHLLAAYQSHTSILGTGISAMPSIHVAVAVLNAWVLTSLNRHLGILGWFYVALIQVTSVYLGWHYAVDGYASIMLVSAIWWVAGRMLNQRAAAVPAALHRSAVPA
jgi:hypothetical protein